MAAFVLACLVVDLFPHHGPPHFRYTGSDPAYSVWNLGWPLAMFIYDPRSGLHVGPTVYFVLLFQLLVVIGGLAAILAMRLLRRGSGSRKKDGMGRLTPPLILLFFMVGCDPQISRPGHDPWLLLRASADVSILNEFADVGTQHELDLARVRLNTPDAVSFLQATYKLQPASSTSQTEVVAISSPPSWWYPTAPAEQYEAHDFAAGRFLIVWVDRATQTAYIAQGSI